METINYVSQYERIIDRIKHDQVSDTNNHKIYPFKYMKNFRIDPYAGGPMYCDYCGEEIEGNGSYICDHLVFHSATDIRLCCSIKHCFPGNKSLLSYSEQIYGYANPVELGVYHDSFNHRLVYHNLHSTDLYKLNQFKKSGVKAADVLQLNGFWNVGGGSSIDNGMDWYDRQTLKYSKTDFPAYLKTKPLVKLTNGDIAEILTDIVMQNKQLTLF